MSNIIFMSIWVIWALQNWYGYLRIVIAEYETDRAKSLYRFKETHFFLDKFDTPTKAVFLIFDTIFVEQIVFCFKICVIIYIKGESRSGLIWHVSQGFSLFHWPKIALNLNLAT